MGWSQSASKPRHSFKARNDASPESRNRRFILHLPQDVRNFMLQERTVAGKGSAEGFDGYLPAQVAKCKKSSVPVKNVGRIV